MKVPRDVSGAELIRALGILGYEMIRQSGSHIRLRSWQTGAEHLITVPNHRPVKIGTLNAILTDVAKFRGWSRDEVIEKIWL